LGVRCVATWISGTISEQFGYEKRPRDTVEPTQQAIWRVARLVSLPASDGIRQRFDHPQLLPFGRATLREMAQGAVSRAISRAGLAGRATEIDAARAGIAAVDNK